MAIYNTAILSTNTTLASGSGDRAITTIIVCNTDTSNLVLNLYAVASGNSVGPGTQIVSALTVPAGDTVSFDQEKMVLATGDQIIASSYPGTGLTATVSVLAV